jgi:hypothetical protein
MRQVPPEQKPVQTLAHILSASRTFQGSMIGLMVAPPVVRGGTLSVACVPHTRSMNLCEGAKGTGKASAPNICLLRVELCVQHVHVCSMCYSMMLIIDHVEVVRHSTRCTSTSTIWTTTDY